MKITIKENGSLLIDGENNTTIKSKADAGINLKIQGNNCHTFTDFIKIEGDKEDSLHEIKNFTFINNQGDYFGKKVKSSEGQVLYIGTDRLGNQLYWNEETKSILSKRKA